MKAVQIAKYGGQEVLKLVDGISAVFLMSAGLAGLATVPIIGFNSSPTKA